jgi:hypothetical protein
MMRRVESTKTYRDLSLRLYERKMTFGRESRRMVLRWD